MPAMPMTIPSNFQAPSTDMLHATQGALQAAAKCLLARQLPPSTGPGTKTMPIEIDDDDDDHAESPTPPQASSRGDAPQSAAATRLLTNEREGKSYTRAENEVLWKLKAKGLSFEEIANRHLNDRTQDGLREQWSKLELAGTAKHARGQLSRPTTATMQLTLALEEDMDALLEGSNGMTRPQWETRFEKAFPKDLNGRRTLTLVAYWVASKSRTGRTLNFVTW